jgi:hypothetical protein
VVVGVDVVVVVPVGVVVGGEPVDVGVGPSDDPTDPHPERPARPALAAAKSVRRSMCSRVRG